MGTGLRGAVILTWAQTEIEGSPAEPNQQLAEGMRWRWHGHALPLEGEGAALILMASRDQQELRSRASRVVRKIMQHPAPGPADWAADAADPLFRDAVVVSDGQRFFTLIPILIDDPSGATPPFLLSTGPLPPPDRDLMVVRCPDGGVRRTASEAARVICFTPGMRIATPRGPVPVERLGPGDRVLTRDAGPQPVVWTARQALKASRLHAAPPLRPIRVAAGAVAAADDLVISPDHRLLVAGPSVTALWGEPEALVRAVDLLDLPGVGVDHRLAGVCYIHLMLERHHCLSCNGIWTDSFHPAHAPLGQLRDHDRDALAAVDPGVLAGPEAFGPPARRMLSRAEAALLVHGPQGTGGTGFRIIGA
jgi:hypothetical protein